MNNYQAAAAQGFGPPASPHAAAAAAAQGAQRAAFPAASSPGPALDMYNSSGAGPGDSVGYVQAASPQPSSFPAIAVSRAPLNYSPVSLKVSYPGFILLFIMGVHSCKLLDLTIVVSKGHNSCKQGTRFF